VFHKNRGSIGSDSEERALTKRKLPAAPSKNVESQDSGGIDKQHCDLESHEVRSGQRNENENQEKEYG
jgi:hypothetical protein